jgi:hypothetical protein
MKETFIKIPGQESILLLSQQLHLQTRCESIHGKGHQNLVQDNILREFEYCTLRVLPLLCDKSKRDFLQEKSSKAEATVLDRSQLWMLRRDSRRP